MVRDLVKENKKLKEIIVNLAYIAESIIEKVDIISNSLDNDLSRELAGSLIELQYAIKKAKGIKHE